MMCQFKKNIFINKIIIIQKQKLNKNKINQEISKLV